MTITQLQRLLDQAWYYGRTAGILLAQPEEDATVNDYKTWRQAQLDGYVQTVKNSLDELTLTAIERITG